MAASLYNSFLTGAILKRIDKEVVDLGIPEAMRRLLIKTNTKLSIRNINAEVRKTMQNGPTLVICNHPAEADVLVLLSSLQKRDDAYLVANHSFMNILPSMDKQIIPVYMNHRIVENYHLDKWKLRFFRKIHHSEHYCADEAHKRNIASISSATQKIDNGGLVAIFPAAASKDGKFSPGVGHMVKNLKNPAKVKVLMAYVQGTSNLDYLRAIPFIGKLMPTIKISFSMPISLSDFWGESAREIASNLEKRYLEWTSSIA